MTPAPDVQLRWFSTALEELPAFLRSADVFRPLHHPPPGLPQDLSLGGMLLAADALSFLPNEVTSELHTSADQALRLWETERTSKAAAIEAKAGAELPHRLNLWRAYLQDLAEKPNEAAAYATEVRHRVIIERLLPFLRGSVGPGAGRLARADEQLRLRFRAGQFAWPPELKQAYSEGLFWYLYGGLSETR